MDRRNFFKGMFGAAVIATMPKIVVKQIEELPPEEITPVTPAPVIPTPEPIKTKGIFSGNCLYLYDDAGLIAASTLFRLEFSRSWQEQDSFSGWKEYTQGPMEWRISAEKLRWINGQAGMDYLVGMKPLKCLIHHDNLKIQGEVYLTECTLTAPCDDIIEEDIVLAGVGELIIIVDTDDDTNITPEIGTAKRAETTDRKVLKSATPRPAGIPQRFA